MPPEFFQTHQDTRTWCLEKLIVKEGHLETRMYACADYAIEHGITEDLNELYTLWEDWKIKHPRTDTQINRL
jgi:hypothetical protein